MNMIRVLLCYSNAPRHVHEQVLELPKDTTIAGALQEIAKEMPQERSKEVTQEMTQEMTSGVEENTKDIADRVGIWGKKCGLEQVLQDGDRLEIYRPLRVDPKTARRERFAKQGGAKTAGLFVSRRAGAKPGY